jgi:RNA polymerase sigma-70 factor, ECF subfamily
VARFTVISGGRVESVGPRPSRTEQDGGLLAELYARHAPAVFGRCRWLLRDEEAAKDATQDVFAKALRALPEFRASSSPTTWLLRIATHHCLNEVRSVRARWHEEVVRIAALRQEDGLEPDRRELVRVLLRLAGREEQEMAVMYFVDELTQAEIAAATGRSLPTVRKRLRGFLATARAALAEALPGIALPEKEEEP